MSMPLKKNDDITLEITGANSEGAGVGRYEGLAVFVPFSLPGETVTAHIIKAARSYAVGKLIGVLKASPDRIEPACPVFYKCGGCALQHMSYAAQLEYKRGVVRDALARIGGFTDIEVRPTIGMEDPLRYRNKGSFPFACAEGHVAWGLFAPRSHRLVEVPDCMIECRSAVLAAKAVRSWAEDLGVSAYDEDTCSGVLRHTVTRECSGGVSVCVVTTGELPHKEELISRILCGVPNVKSIVHNINRKDTNVICGDEDRVIWGSDTVTHSLCGLDFEVSRESFLQVNTIQCEKLYSLAAEGLELDENSTVADIFCGIGTITLLLAKRAKRAVGIEYVEKAVEDARRNALKNGIDNAEFFCGAAEKVLPRLVKSGMRFDCVSLDPPRKGADPAVLEAIAASGANRIAYISCDPATLARDLKLLCGFGYGIDSVQPVDMFPFTYHCEVVCKLLRSDINS